MADKTRGRPKTDHSRPLIFQRARARVVREIPITAKIAATLDRYVEWAAVQTNADKEEILILAIEQSLELLFKKDRLFQKTITDSTQAGTSCERSPIDHPAVTAKDGQRCSAD